MLNPSRVQQAATWTLPTPYLPLLLLQIGELQSENNMLRREMATKNQMIDILSSASKCVAGGHVSAAVAAPSWPSCVGAC